jgi:hypothetical protein
MIEVFKTNITNPEQALFIVDRIHETFNGYKANFDLQDCDHILRIQSLNGSMDVQSLVDFLSGLHCTVQVLPDELELSWNAKCKIENVE